MRDLVKIAPDVYIYPRDETPNVIQPNIGILRRGAETVLIDAGNSPRHALQISRSIHTQGLPPISTIIFTHHHWDHTFAADSLDARRIIAHEMCAEALAAFAEREWNPGVLADEIAENPKREVSHNAMIDAIREWQHLRIVTPTMTFSKSLTLHHETMPIVLSHVGGRHAEDSIMVHLPKQGVLFVGDSYYPPPYHIREEGDEDLALPMLDTFLEMGCDMYIDGHGPPRSREDFKQMIEWERGRQNAKS